MKRLIIYSVMLLTALVFSSAPLLAQEAPKINKKNLVIKEWNTDVKSGTKFLDHVTTYSPEGLKLEEIEYNSSGQKWRERYEYGENGKVAKTMIYDGRNRLVSIKKYEYNAYGRKKVTYTYDAKGRLTMTKNYEYLMQDE